MPEHAWIALFEHTALPPAHGGGPHMHAPARACSLRACPPIRLPACLPFLHCICREQLADSVLTLLFAGHDTSATTLTRLFSHLHRHPAAAERLRLEQVRQRHPRTAAAAAGRRVCRPAAVLFDT